MEVPDTIVTLNHLHPSCYFVLAADLTRCSVGVVFNGVSPAMVLFIINNKVGIHANFVRVLCVLIMILQEACRGIVLQFMVLPDSFHS